MRIFGFLILMLVVGAAAGQDARFSFTVIPNPPAANQPFQVRVTLAALSCYTLPSAIIATHPSPNVVQYELHMDDSCLPLPEQQRTYSVPALSPGQYTFRLAGCLRPDPLLPPPSCGIAAEQTVSVALVPLTANVIPILSSLTLTLLIGVMATLGAFVLRSP